MINRRGRADRGGMILIPISAASAFSAVQIQFARTRQNFAWQREHTRRIVPAPRAVAQLGSALEWGSRGRGFESRRPES